MGTTYHFANGDQYLANTDAGQAALVEYEAMRAQGASHDQAELAASNLLQRAGFNVNAKGGVTIEADE